MSSGTRFGLVLALALLSACDSAQQNTMPTGPAEVEVVTLAESDVTLTTELPGRTTAFRKAEIRPQVNGIIVKRLFQEGAEITAGEQLYQIDDASYKAAHATAQARLAEARAQLAAARARESRYKNLLAQKAISQQDYDDAQASFLQAEAAVKAAEAAVETAEISVEYSRVLAPISGRIGKSSVTEGALVTAGQPQPLAVIQQLDPIYIDVSQSVDQLLNIRRQILQGDLVSDAHPVVRLILDDGSVYSHEGKLEFSEVDVNESTGTVVSRALFPNPDHLLLPGMFVRAEIVEGTRPDSVLVPQRAVTHDRQGRATTLVVNGDNVVETRELATGRAVGDQWLVLSGLQAGEEVIVAGHQKVQPGVAVTTVPSPLPPSPDDSGELDMAAGQAEVR